MRNLFHFRSDEPYIAPNEQIPTTLGAIILSVLLICSIPLLGRYSQSWYNGWMLSSGLIGYVLGKIWEAFWLLHLERRRLAAISGSHWLASTQPMISSFTIQRPSTIVWRAKWQYITPWLLITGWWLAFANWQILVLIVALGIVLLVIFFLRLKIEITENGLSEGGRGVGEKTINWSEARLFVCYRIPIIFWGKNIVHYELSSQTTRVSWMWVSNLQSPFTAWTTELPSDEYDRQMQALCALIVEKTGLQLYDLSQSIEKKA